MIAPLFFAVLAFAAFEVQAGPTCPLRDGKYPVYIPHKDCTKFWECSNGVPYLFNCPADLHFNPKLNVCDWPDQAGCKGGSGGKPGKPEKPSDPGSGGDDSKDSSSDSSSSSSSESRED